MRRSLALRSAPRPAPCLSAGWSKVVRCLSSGGRRLQVGPPLLLARLLAGSPPPPPLTDGKGIRFLREEADVACVACPAIGQPENAFEVRGRSCGATRRHPGRPWLCSSTWGGNVEPPLPRRRGCHRHYPHPHPWQRHSRYHHRCPPTTSATAATTSASTAPGVAVGHRHQSHLRQGRRPP